MARKKTVPVEEEMKEEVPFEPAEKCCEPKGMISQEAAGHLIRAATEFMGAMDSMMPKKKVPDEIKIHYLAAKKEMMLMARAILDAKIAACETGQTTQTAEEPRVKKIELE